VLMAQLAVTFDLREGRPAPTHILTLTVAHLSDSASAPLNQTVANPLPHAIDKTFRHLVLRFILSTLPGRDTGVGHEVRGRVPLAVLALVEHDLHRHPSVMSVHESLGDGHGGEGVGPHEDGPLGSVEGVDVHSAGVVKADVRAARGKIVRRAPRGSGGAPA
jgi:hypothetical protein